MKLHLRLDAVNDAHIYQTVFIDGQKAGNLVLRPGDYQVLGAALLIAAERMAGHFAVTLDPIGWTKDGEFAKPGTPECVRQEP